jgi:formylglycine-generating enzyme required for sulfatase activity
VAGTAALLGATLGVAHCSDVTEVVVVVDSDLAPAKDVDRVEVRVESEGRAAPVRQALAPLAFPLTLGVSAADSTGAPLEVVAIAYLGQAVVTRTTVTAVMRPGESSLLHVSLCRGCGAAGCTIGLAEGLAPWNGQPPAQNRCADPGYVDGGGAGEGGPGGPGEAGACPDDMTTVTVTGRSFCVDRTEVSQRAYGAFVAAKGTDMDGQGELCSFNTSYARAANTDPLGCNTRLDPEGTPDLPVVCIDWCDAFAFCKWKGKRLCGSIGGGPTPFTGIYENGIDQWMAACTARGPFFYGPDYDPSRCNGGRIDDAGRTWDVGSQPRCSGGPDGSIRDMIGNVGEFEDSCATADAAVPYLDFCVFRGGAAGNEGTGAEKFLRCGSPPDSGQVLLLRRYGGTDFVGFRCCADL